MSISAVQREYGRMAASYDSRWSGYVARTTSLALNALPLFPDARLLDIGCGTGVLLHCALERQPTLTCIGVDLTAEMLAQAAARLPRDVLLVQATGESLPIGNQRVDLVVSTSALHYMSSPIAVLHEAWRILKPGGTLVVTDWSADYFTMRLLDRVLRVIDPAHMHTMRVKQLAGLFRDAAFIAIEPSMEKTDRFWGIMTVRGQKPVE